ncbi:MAG TPA: hypothetical protein VK870_14095 [Ignavibacteriaceae bacterium]|nr:hypothetical protein [Ignavibacteriaceae bacterium]
MIYLNALIPWFIMVVLAILNGTIRQSFILSYTTEPVAHIISTLMFLIIQFLVICFYVQIKCVKEKSALVRIGIFWIALTILFEFVFGHYVMNHPWEKLLADYNVFAGRLWLLVLLNNIIAPLTSEKLNK